MVGQHLWRFAAQLNLRKMVRVTNLSMPNKKKRWQRPIRKKPTILWKRIITRFWISAERYFTDWIEKKISISVMKITLKMQQISRISCNFLQWDSVWGQMMKSSKVKVERPLFMSWLYLQCAIRYFVIYFSHYLLFIVAFKIGNLIIFLFVVTKTNDICLTKTNDICLCVNII